MSTTYLFRCTAFGRTMLHEVCVDENGIVRAWDGHKFRADHGIPSRECLAIIRLAGV